MSKFNTKTTRAARGSGPVTTVAPGLTYENGPGHVRGVKGELFLLAVANFVGEDTFYESATDRDARFDRLVRQATNEDPEWTARLLAWLRAEGNMRSAPMVGAAIFAHERLARGEAGMSRQVVDSVLRRADEPGELLAYWTSRFGRAIPKPVKRGVADSVRRLYTERNLLKYDTATKGFRFADVIELVHPRAATPAQGDLFAYALDRRHDRGEPPATLDLIRRHHELMATEAGQRRERLADVGAAGVTWEALAGWLQGPMDAAAWTAAIPSMGYMALLRNLRNFDEAGVDDDVAATVAAKLADPREVARSRQFPFRFLSAYDNAPSLRWGHALDKAFAASLANVPVLPGRSLVLIDTSASMQSSYSKRSTVSPAKAAAVFGVVLAMRSGADLYGFADGVFRQKVGPGASPLKAINEFLARTGQVGHGTEIAKSLRATYAGHDRVFVISDMQTFGGPRSDVSTAVPESVALYGFNLGGYRVTAIEAGTTNRIELGGLTDATFRMVPLIEAGRRAEWPV